MFNIVLVHPQIPPNTGNVIRLCANTGNSLHLVKPMGFKIEDAQLKRAGLDYHEYASMKVHEDWQTFLATEQPNPMRMFALTTKGSQPFANVQFTAGDWLIFGSETAGLPDAIRNQFEASNRIRLPMMPQNRSLNLSNAVAIVVYEAWRQNDYAGGA